MPCSLLRENSTSFHVISIIVRTGLPSSRLPGTVSLIDAARARIVCDEGSVYRSGVRPSFCPSVCQIWSTVAVYGLTGPSVCLSHRSTAAATCGWFAAELGRVKLISIDSCRCHVRTGYRLITAGARAATARSVMSSGGDPEGFGGQRTPTFLSGGVTYKAVAPSFDAMLMSLFSLYILMVMDGDGCRCSSSALI